MNTCKCFVYIFDEDVDIHSPHHAILKKYTRQDTGV